MGKSEIVAPPKEAPVSGDRQVTIREHAQRASDWMQSAAGHRAFEGVSIVYFCLPVVIFCAGWLQPWLGMPLSALVVYSAWRVGMRAMPDDAAHPADFTPRRSRAFLLDVLLVCLTAAGFVACTGIGGFSYQFSDYPFYNSFIRDLIEVPWPLSYAQIGSQGEPMLAVYYFGYYLPCALVGKFLGWYAAYWFLYVWAVVGVVLVAGWMARILGSTGLFAVCLFLFFSGLDVAGRAALQMFTNGVDVSAYDLVTGNYWWSVGRGWLDHWMADFALFQGREQMNSVFFKFYAPSTFLVDGPYHILPGTVGVMMLFHDFIAKKTVARAGFLYACIPISSIFLALGIAPFVAWAVLRGRFKGAFTFSNLVTGVPLLGVFVAYFGSVGTSGTVTGWLWQFQDLSVTWIYLLLFYVVEFGLFALIVVSSPDARARIFPGFLGLSLVILLFAPLYRYGVHNDFTVKFVIPSQYVLIICVGFVLQDSRLRFRRYAAIALLLVGSLTPLGTVLRALQFGFTGMPPAQNFVRHVNEVLPLDLALQGKGDEDSLFWSTLARPAVYSTTPEIPVAREWNFALKTTVLGNWYIFEKDWKRTAQGIEINTTGNQPLIRTRIDDLNVAHIGHAELDVRIESPDGEPIDGEIVLLWGYQDEPGNISAQWIFPKNHSFCVYPQDRALRANPYWRAPVNDIALFLKMDADIPCRVILRRITFLER